MHNVIEKKLEVNLPPTFWLLTVQPRQTCKRKIKLRHVLHNMSCIVLVFTQQLDYTTSQRSPVSEVKNYGPEK
jgi:hypothetical protein